MRDSEAACGQLHLDEEGALVLLRQEALRRSSSRWSRSRRPRPAVTASDRMATRTSRAHDGGIAVPHLVDAAQDIALIGPRRGPVCAEEQHAERRRQRQRVDRRDHHRRRDRHRELPEQHAGQAGDEGDRDEDREQHQRDGDDRRGDLAHRLLGRRGWASVRMLLHHPLDILDHDDGVVDHDADGQHHAEQRDGVGAVADGQQDGEGADQADRHRDGRDQRRPQRAQEEEDDDDHEDEGLEQRLDHLLDRVDHEGGAVVEHRRPQPFGVAGGELSSVFRMAAATDTALAPGER